jgi:hypothetical protein
MNNIRILMAAELVKHLREKDAAAAADKGSYS